MIGLRPSFNCPRNVFSTSLSERLRRIRCGRSDRTQTSSTDCNLVPMPVFVDALTEHAPVEIHLPSDLDTSQPQSVSNVVGRPKAEIASLKNHGRCCPRTRHPDT